MALTEFLTTDRALASVFNTKVVTPANEHINTDVDNGEAHGMRVNPTTKSLEYYDGTKWWIVSNGLPVAKVTDFTATAGDTKVTLTWDDPTDLIVDGATLATWAKTRIVRKTGSYPVDENDGTIVVESSVRDQYKATGYEDIGLVNGTQYYYMAFPITTAGIVTVDNTSRATATPQPYAIYGVSIDLTNSNPLTAVTYTDGAVGVAKGSAAWDAMAIFKDIKPCVLLNGVVQYYLNPNDFSKKADGTAADITSGAAGDVMIEIPKIGFKITTVGNTLTVKITENPADSNYKYYAHTRATEGDRNKLYVGAFLGYNLSSKFRS